MAYQVSLVVKNLFANAEYIRDVGSVPELRRSSGGEHGHPLLYSCLENPMERGAWWVILHGVAELDTTERLAHTYILLIGASLVAQMVKNLPAT